MSRLRVSGGLVGGVAALLLVAGCSGDEIGTPDRASASPAPTTTSPSNGQATGGPFTGEDAEVVASVELLHQVLDEVVQGTADEASLDFVMVPDGPGRDFWAQTVADYQQRGIVQTGSRQVTVLNIAESADGVRIVDLCLDVSDIDMLDENGQSVVQEGRPDRLLHHHVMQRVRGADGGQGWLVFDYIPTEDPC